MKKTNQSKVRKPLPEQAIRINNKNIWDSQMYEKPATEEELAHYVIKCIESTASEGVNLRFDSVGLNQTKPEGKVLFGKKVG